MRCIHFFSIFFISTLTGCYSLPEPKVPALVALPTIGSIENSKMKTFPQGKQVHAAVILSENFKNQIKYSEDYIEYLQSFPDYSGDAGLILDARAYLTNPGLMPYWLHQTLNKYFEFVTFHDDIKSAEKLNPDVFVMAEWQYFQGGNKSNSTSATGYLSFYDSHFRIIGVARGEASKPNKAIWATGGPAIAAEIRSFIRVPKAAMKQIDNGITEIAKRK